MSVSEGDHNLSAFGPLIHGRNTALARNWWAVLLRGVIAVLFGIAAFVLPGALLGSLVLVFGIYAIVDGCLPSFPRCVPPRIMSDGCCCWWKVSSTSAPAWSRCSCRRSPS